MSICCESPTMNEEKPIKDDQLVNGWTFFSEKGIEGVRVLFSLYTW